MSCVLSGNLCHSSKHLIHAYTTFEASFLKRGYSNQFVPNGTSQSTSLTDVNSSRSPKQVTLLWWLLFTREASCGNWASPSLFVRSAEIVILAGHFSLVDRKSMLLKAQVEMFLQKQMMKVLAQGP